MLFKEIYKIITNSEIFKDFIKENKSAMLCAGFFIMDFFGNDTKRSLDYKSGEKIYTFNLRDDDSIKLDEDNLIENKDKKFPQFLSINPDIKIDLDEVKSIAQIRTLDEGISAKYNKIIAVLQNYDNKQTWNLTCMLDGLIILHILIDAETGDVIKFERKSMMDLIRKK